MSGQWCESRRTFKSQNRIISFSLLCLLSSSLAHLLASHPILQSTSANQHVELVSLEKETHPTSVVTAISTTTVAASSSSDSITAVTPRISLPSSQFLSLIEILTSSFRRRLTGTHQIRNTRESHTHSLVSSSALLQPLKEYQLKSLDLSSFSYIDTPVVRVLLHLPSLHTLNLSSCRLITDSAISLIFNNRKMMSHLLDLDVSENSHLTGKGWILDGGMEVQQEQQAQVDADDDTYNTIDDNTHSISTPSALTSLNLSNCSNIKPSSTNPLSAKFFTPLINENVADASSPATHCYLSSLQHLDICSTNDRLFLAVWKILSFLPKIRWLDMQNVGWKEATLRDTGGAAANTTTPSVTSPPPFSLSNLTYLNLSYGYLSNDPALIKFFRAIQDVNEKRKQQEEECESSSSHSRNNSSTSLHTLILSHCLIRSEQIFSLILQSTSPSLRILHMNDLITNEFLFQFTSLHSLQDSIDFSRLEEFDGSRCIIIPELFFTILSMIARNLRKLVLRDLRLHMMEESELSSESDEEDEEQEQTQQQDPEVAAAEEAGRQEDYRIICEHARRHGLPIPPPPASSSSSSSSIAASSRRRSHPHHQPLHQRAVYGPSFARTLVSKRHLTHLDLAVNRQLTDMDLQAWSVEEREYRLQNEEDEQLLGTSLKYLDLSRCPHLTSRGLAELLMTLLKSDSNDSPHHLQVIAHECPLIDADEVRRVWRENEREEEMMKSILLDATQQFEL